MMTQNSDTIYVYIQTYELGKDYLKRALDSIRNQTYPNFRCLVYDNCSGSEVRRGLQEYVSQDERFSLTFFDNTEGRVLAWEYGIPEILRMAGDTGGYFFRLDADDELEPSCFEKMVDYIKAGSLDMVASSIFFVDGETGKVLGDRKIDENIILEGNLFEKYFPKYYQIMRTHWAKLYRLDLLKKMNLSNLQIATYGSDTLFVREALLWSQRVGVLSDMLYKYYLYQEVREYNLAESRAYAPQLLFERDISFLMLKCGDVSVDTLVWLLKVYFAENQDFFRLVSKMDRTNQEKIDSIYKILTTIPCRFAIRAAYRPQYLFVAEWLKEQNIFENDQTFRQAAEIFGMLGVIPVWLKGVAVADQFRMLVMIYAYWDDPERKPLLEEEIQKHMHTSQILQNTDAYYGRYNADIVRDILKEDYRSAYAGVRESLEQHNRFVTQFYETNLELALNLAALLNLETDFVLWKKKHIELLMKKGLLEPAGEEVEEWLEILPEDSDFIGYKTQIAEKKGER